MKKLSYLLGLIALVCAAIWIPYQTIHAEDGLTISISSPVNGSTINENENILFSFSWLYPDTHTFTNYEYTIKKIRNWRVVTGGTITNSWLQSFTYDLEDWKYDFIVRMNTANEWFNPHEEESAWFIVVDDVDLNITSPWTNVTSTWATFSRNGIASTFSGYIYEVESTNAPYYYSWSSSDINDNSFPLDDLLDWNYTFTVTMYYTWWHYISGSTSFRVKLPYTLKINSPTSWSTIRSSSVDFSWTGTHPYKSWFCYTLSGINNSTRLNDCTTDTTWFQNLEDGTYSFKLEMMSNLSPNDVLYSTWIKFSVDADKTLSVTSSPSWKITRNNVTWVDVTLTWTWDNDWFSGYNYTLKRNWTLRDSWTSSSKKDNKTYEMLPSWTYRFDIDMISSTDWSVITSDYATFTIEIPTTLTISSNTNWNNATLSRTWFAENFGYYEYNLDRTDITENITWWTTDAYYGWFTIGWLHYWNYKLSVNMKDPWWTIITGKNVTFSISDNLDFSTSIQSWNSTITPWSTINSRSATFSRSWQSEDLSWFYYEISGTTFKDEAYSVTWIQTWNISWELYKAWHWSITLNNLQTWRYRFTVKMLSWNNINTSFNEKSIDFNVSIPSYLTITSPISWSTITSSNSTFSWTWYSDTITKYEYELTGEPIQSTTSTSFTTNNLKNWNYTLKVWLYSWGNPVANDSISFTVNIPARSSGWWWSSSKTHYTNNLKLSIWNESPAANEWIELIVKIDDKYTWKVIFPKLQYYSWDTEKWEDIPVTSKIFVSDYSDDAKLGYVRFSSDDDWKKKLSQFIKFSKNWYYRIYAEDKDWYDEYVQFYVGKINNNTTKTEAPATTNTWKDIDNIIKQYIPQILEDEDTDEEVYIARSCKKYTIRYSDTLMVYTSPNLNMSEYFMNKDYFKRYIDSKNKYQSGCPTNVWWISTSYIDRSNNDSRYTAPNGKVYFITWKEWSYYSEELNKELKTPTNFRTIQELKYYIRDRNPLISMAALWPIN